MKNDLITPYRVLCLECGPQCLSPEEYHRQMCRPDSLWKCPYCGDSAQWDDDWFESYMDASTDEDEG